jgi:hypothetical protein
VAVDEIKRLQPEPAGDRRRGGQRQHHAGQHQRADRGQGQPVDRPPPFAERRALCARNHVPTFGLKLTRHGLRTINIAVIARESGQSSTLSPWKFWDKGRPNLDCSVQSIESSNRASTF